MKTKALLTLIVVVATSVSVFAARRAWVAAKRPPVSLGLAYALYLDDLRSRFAKEAEEYYCIRANLLRTLTSADWELKFHREGVEDDGVAYSVGSDKSIRFAEGGFEY